MSLRETFQPKEMEIELFLREISREMWFYPRRESHEDYHHIKIVEEVEHDGKEEVVCPLCQKAALLSPAFKCLDCRILFHISCLKVEKIQDPTNRLERQVDEYLQTLISHCDPSTRHELIFEEQLQNYGNKEAVCFACDEPVVGPAHKCSASNCDLLFHNSCAHLPRKTQHPLYDPNGTLYMHLATGYYNPITEVVNYDCCNVCGKKCKKCLRYRDSKGEFILDVACSNRWRINNAYDCQRHTFIPVRVNFTFTCQACGIEDKDLALLCTTCRLFINTKCSWISRAIRISHHKHSLVLILPLRHLKDSDDIPCNICARKVSTEYAAYCCQVCDFVAHLPCTERFWLRDETIESSSRESVTLLTNDVEKMTLEEIHQHKLILNDEQLTNDKLCDICMRFISASPFYSCMQCNFFLHATCAQLPRQKHHPLHPHPLTLLSKLRSQELIEDDTFRCDACYRRCRGFHYNCKKCLFHLDIHCCLIPQTLTHPSHQHSLFLAVSRDKHCSACGKISDFLCLDCHYSLCYSCVTLPLNVRHEYDKHFLALTHAAKEKFEEYYCLFCEEKRDPNSWFYYCQECDFSAHIECVFGKFPYIKVGSNYKDSRHEHHLTFVRKRPEASFPCDACGKPFRGLAVECTQCKFNIHCNWDIIDGPSCMLRMRFRLREARKKAHHNL